MEQQVHGGQSCGAVNQFGAVDEGVAQVFPLGRGELLSILGREVMRR
jgi:hypothetical protein